MATAPEKRGAAKPVKSGPAATPAATATPTSKPTPTAKSAPTPGGAAPIARTGAIHVGPPVVTGLHLQHAVEEALAAHDPQRLHALQSGLRTSAPDDDRRAIAYGFLRLALEESGAGRFAEAHDRVRAAGVARGKPDSVVAVVSGNVSMAEARRLDGEARERVLEQAAASYATACRDDPLRADALHGWGSALAASVRTQKGVKAERTLALAAEKLAAAVAVDGTRVESIVQWAHVLVARADARLTKARWRPGPDLDAAGVLLDEACVRLAEADRLAPKRFDVSLAWGGALFRRGRTRAGSEAAALLDGAAERFKLAAKQADDAARSGVLRSWANALAARARAGDPADADRIRARAVEKYEEAAELRTDDDIADLRLAAEVQLERAAAKKGARREELADDARAKLVKASKRAPEDAALLFSLARAHSLADDPAKCVGALECWAETAERAPRKALDSCPDFDPVREDERFVAFRRTR